MEEHPTDRGDLRSATQQDPCSASNDDTMEIDETCVQTTDAEAPASPKIYRRRRKTSFNQLMQDDTPSLDNPVPGKKSRTNSESTIHEIAEIAAVSGDLNPGSKRGTDILPLLLSYLLPLQPLSR